MLEDPDSNVKEAATLLDRLIKEIVTRSGDEFEVELFIPLLCSYLNNENPYVRELLLQWIILLTNTPGIELLECLPKFLDGLFKMLEDEKSDIIKQTEIVLTDFLREICAQVHINLHPMVNILILQIKNTGHSNNRRLFGLIWLNEFLKLGQFKLCSYFSNILIALLQCIHEENAEITQHAYKTNEELYALIKRFPSLNCDLHELHTYQLLQILIGACKSSVYVKTRIAALNFICMMITNLDFNLNELIMDGNEEKINGNGNDYQLFPVLLGLLCDENNEVLELTLQVLANISCKPKYFHQVLLHLLRIFRSNSKNLLAIRGKFIIEKLCELLGSKKVYVALAKFLLEEKDIQFCSLMIQSLNIILLTANTMHMQSLRLSMDAEVNDELFIDLFGAWCYDPISTLSLCLMARMYELGAKLVLYFSNVDITIGFLMQVDKLVTLLESPTFVHLRLELLEPHKYPYLLKIMYGLLMLLPQNTAFNSLRIRLQSASSFGLLQNCRIPLSFKSKQKFDIHVLFDQFVRVQNSFVKQRLSKQLSLKIQSDIHLDEDVVVDEENANSVKGDKYIKNKGKQFQVSAVEAMHD